MTLAFLVPALRRVVPAAPLAAPPPAPGSIAPERRAALRAAAAAQGRATAAWWRDRAPRERRLLAALAAVALVTGLDRLVWRPLAGARDAAIAERARDARLAAQLRAAGPEVARLVAARRAGLAALVTSHAAQAGLTITRLDPQGAAVAVTLDGVEFDRLTAWLAALDRDAGVVARDLKVERRAEPGMVGAQATLAER